MGFLNLLLGGAQTHISYMEAAGWLFGVDLWHLMDLELRGGVIGFKGGAFARVVRFLVDTSSPGSSRLGTPLYEDRISPT